MKNAKLPGLRTLFKPLVRRCHACCMTLRFRRSLVTDKKGRRAKFSLFRSLQNNKQQNQ